MRRGIPNFALWFSRDELMNLRTKKTKEEMTKALKLICKVYCELMMRVVVLPVFLLTAAAELFTGIVEEDEL